jgi:hypothetical protein
MLVCPDSEDAGEAFVVLGSCKRTKMQVVWAVGKRTRVRTRVRTTVLVLFGVCTFTLFSALGDGYSEIHGWKCSVDNGRLKED